MTFDEWKCKMLINGHLCMAKRSHTICFPYTSKVGFGIKYQRLVGNADLKGIKVMLTFDQYLKLAYNVGMNSPTEIGTKMNSYQMGRIGDVGDYIQGNCRFIPRTQNMQERTDNGGAKRQGDKIRGIKDPRRGIVHKGVNNRRFCGYYITPKGRFVTTHEAAEANGCGTMTVYDRCKKCDRVISRHATNTVSTLGQHALGKTYRELGWYFEEITNDSRT